jgi:PAP2 superfamily
LKKLLVIFVLCWPRLGVADAVTDWNEITADASIAARLSTGDASLDPLHESRIFAMLHVAIHDSLNAIERRYKPYAFDGRAHRGASAEAAVAAAARDVLVPLFRKIPNPPFPAGSGDAAIGIIETAYTSALAAIPDGRAKTAGISVGRASAASILARRDALAPIAADGSDATFLDYSYDVSGSQPGDFQFIPGFPFAVGPDWGKVTPFVLRSSTQYPPQPPYRLTSKRYADDFNEVKSLGAANSATRTPEQTEIALFWVESSVLGWNRIARTVSAQCGLDLWEKARLFGLLNLASADGYIADFQNKYAYRFWRPITAIRAAESDGNPDTIADPEWESLRPTPAAPDYTSGHSVQGGAMSEVLARFFGTDKVSFRTTSTTLPGAIRSFSSFLEAAEENGNSRVYVGFHFRHAVAEGIKLGRKIGRCTFEHYLQEAECRAGDSEHETPPY